MFDRMKNRRIGSSFSEEEIEVSNVLLDLPKLVFKSETLRLLSVRVPTRRRSSPAGAGNSSTSNIKNSPETIIAPTSSVDSGSGYSMLKSSSTNPNYNPVLKLKFVRTCINVKKNPSFNVDLELCSSNKQLQILSPKKSPEESKNVVFDFDLNQEWRPTTSDHDREEEKQETQQQQLSYNAGGGGIDLWAPEFDDVNRLLREHYNRKTAEARRNRAMKMRGKKYLKLSLSSSQIRVL